MVIHIEYIYMNTNIYMYIPEKVNLTQLIPRVSTQTKAWGSKSNPASSFTSLLTASYGMHIVHFNNQCNETWNRSKQ